MAAANIMSRFLPLHLHSLTTSVHVGRLLWWGNIILDNFELLLRGGGCMFIYKGTKVGCIVNDSGPCHFIRLDVL